MSAAPPRAAATFDLATPHPRTTSGAAIAIVQVTAPDPRSLDAALTAACGAAPRPGEVILRTIAATDRGLVVRITPTCAHLTIHGGIAVVESLLAALQALGIEHATPPAPSHRYPEAATTEEACMLDAIASAHSPRALDALLAQPALWRAARAASPDVRPDPALSTQLARLITPPTVAVVGAPNIGKSTLLNTLARRELALTADEPGTTRDHIGAMLTLDGLTIRWIDTPGLSSRDSEAQQASGPIDRRAHTLALAIIDSADLIIHCADPTHPFSDLAALGITSHRPPAGILRCGLRADLGPIPGADTLTAAITGEGIDDLAREVRRRLIPDDALRRATTEPWDFHPALRGGA